jgi:hypothetical protein
MIYRKVKEYRSKYLRWRMSNKLWIFVLWVTLLRYTTATNLASYQLDQLGFGTTSISSTISPGAHPRLRFPSKNISILNEFEKHRVFMQINWFVLGYFNSADAPKNPELVVQGLHITQGTYFRIDGSWTQSNTNYSYIFMWLLPIDGIIGTFTDFMISVSFKPTNFWNISNVVRYR